MLASRIYWPESAAASFRLKALVDALVERGADVEVLTSSYRPGSGAVPSAVTARGATVRRWPVLRDRSGYVRGYLPYLSFDVPLLLRLLTTRRPNVVVVEPPPTTGAVVRVVTVLRLALTRRRVPYVYYAADVWSDASASTGAPGAVVAALRALERFAISGAREVIAVSDGVAARVRALGAGRVHVIPNGIDTDVFSPADRPAQASGSSRWARDVPTVPFLVYAGTASEWQGAEVFAEAMRRVVAQVPGARLVFLGQGSSWPALRRVADELPEEAIELRPVVSSLEAAAWLRGAAAALVSVRPGLGYDFAYPTKVLAAAACGTPVVYAGSGPAASDVVEHGLGEAVPYDVASVARAMISALQERSARVESGPHDDAAHRRRSWVLRHRSVRATAKATAEVVVDAAMGPGTRIASWQHLDVRGAGQEEQVWGATADPEGGGRVQTPRG